MLLATIGGCRGERQAVVRDTAAVTTQAIPVAVTPIVNPGWDRDKSGPVMLLRAGDEPSVAAVVIPSLTDSILAQMPHNDADSLAGMRFDLFNRAGSAGTVSLVKTGGTSGAEGCVSWPLMRLEGSERTWLAGFRAGIATPLQLDSLEGVPAADSLRITTQLARLASALPEPDDHAFQGLPFAVRKAYRTSSGSLLIGDIIRRINEEANPREEHLLLVARQSTPETEYSTVFFTRSSGSEDAVRVAEILAAIRFVNGGNIAIVVSFNYENGGRVGLVEQRPDGWKMAWRSAYTGC